jgi:glycosyltransferase involved in cell wall biosynthesis
MKVLIDKSSPDQRPSVAVITVCWNALADLQVTTNSVRRQAYSPLLHIVVDGGSIDGTAEWLEKRRDEFAVALSEPDHGIYDAMNKAVVLSPAVDWFIFLNAGDVFHADDVIQRSIPKLQCRDVDFVFGNVCVTNAANLGRTKIYQARRNSALEMPGCHQSCFVRAKLMRSLKFDLRYRVAGDFEFWLRASRHASATTAFAEHTIATIAPEGFSARNEATLQLEYSRAIKNHIGTAAAIWWLLKRKFRRVAVNFQRLQGGSL